MDDDAELLHELATLDEVVARIPTSKEHDMGTYPDWSELILEVTREPDNDGPGQYPIRQRLPLRRHDGELIVQVLWGVLHPAHSLVAVERMYEELDRAVDKIQKRVSKGREPLATNVGEARGIATAIACMVNPVDPDVDEVREVAMERYEARRAPNSTETT